MDKKKDDQAGNLYGFESESHEVPENFEPLPGSDGHIVEFLSTERGGPHFFAPYMIECYQAAIIHLGGDEIKRVAEKKGISLEEAANLFALSFRSSPT